jgi:hypothetical protein
MFFRRERPKPITFDERLTALRNLGLNVTSSGSQTRVERDGVAAVLGAAQDGKVQVVERPGIIMGSETAGLVDGGYQKFFQTPSGRRKPALAAELKALHDFSEDLREALGFISLYNESLGTVSKYYMYDRVEDRDRGVKRIWEE